MDTQKRITQKDSAQTLTNAFNDVDSSISVGTFLTATVGRKVSLAIATTTVANDSEIYAYSENGIALYSLKITYTDGTRSQFISAERIA